MMLPHQHSRTTTSLNRKDFENFTNFNNKKISENSNFWSSKYRPKDEKIQKQVIDSALSNESCLKSIENNQAVINIACSVSDGTTMETRNLKLINPCGSYIDEEKQITYSGYPMRKFKAEVSHGWFEDLQKNSE